MNKLFIIYFFKFDIFNTDFKISQSYDFIFKFHIKFY